MVLPVPKGVSQPKNRSFRPLSWEVPEPREAFEVSASRRTTIHVRRHGNPDGHRLLITHGNGLAIDHYFPFWFHLLDDCDVFVHDLRNHGWNETTNRRHHSVPVFTDDTLRIMKAIRKRCGDKPIIGVYNSISTLQASLLALTHPDQYEALIFYCPPLCVPGISQVDFDSACIQLANQCLSRPPTYDSMATYRSTLRRMPQMAGIDDDCLDLIAQTTVRARDDGQLDLRCPPEFESQAMKYLPAWATLDVQRMKPPLKLVGADPTLPSFLPNLNFRQLAGFNFDFVPESSHLLQMENPELCAEILLDFVMQELPTLAR